MKDQGKVARTLGDAGSAFLSRPRGLWESDYRFAVGGRLNQLDTHCVLKRGRLRSHDKCRFPGCFLSETLAHVLHHCAGTMDAVRGRHDEALKIIERAVVSSAKDRTDRVELRVNQTVPSLPGPALRPDLQVYNHTTRSVSVVDLAVAFEDQAKEDPRTSTLVRIAELKRTKYDCVAKRSQGNFYWDLVRRSHGSHAPVKPRMLLLVDTGRDGWLAIAHATFCGQDRTAWDEAIGWSLPF
uniref:Uncharacterized protein n=1 Tax=Peronospora matthiolae TaxID=2874970 RepID=A0AAV1VNS5_9STRA